MKHITCDVLVVGGGGGALRAAIAAKEARPDCNVMLATKGHLGKSGVTAVACSDRMAFHATLYHTPPGGVGAWRHHADDIYYIGGEVSDRTLADVLARDAADAYTYLDRLGVPFVKKDGLPLQFVTDGSEYPRACYTGPRTAVHIEMALVQRFHQLEIPVMEHCMVAKLLTNAEGITGALALDTRVKLGDNLTDAVTVINTGNIILATGGAGLIYQHHVFPAGMTGDGNALAYEVGAELVNMEFIQMGVASLKTKLNCSGSMLRAIPRVVDDTGHEFLMDYFPANTPSAQIYNTLFRKGASWPVSCEHDTHIIDIAVYKKVREGRKVYLDYSQNPQGFSFDQLTGQNQTRYDSEIVTELGAQARQSKPLARLQEINPDSIEWLKLHGIDLKADEKVEIAVCGQHFQGGVKINEQGETAVKGLYAVGEVAGGQHGANRPGGNALLDCQVFGRITGENAAHASKRKAQATVSGDEVNQFIAMLSEIANENQAAAEHFRSQLQEVVEGSAGIMRTEAGLQAALAELVSLKNVVIGAGKRTLAYALENKNLLLVGEMVIRAALLRDESRGPHLRFDRYEDNLPLGRNDAWKKYIVISRGEKMTLNSQTPQQQGLTSKHGRFKAESFDDLRELASELKVKIDFQDDLSPLMQRVKIGEFETPNALVVHPMEGCDSTPDGSPDSLTFRRYHRFAEGGAGLLWFEATAVLPEGRANPRHLYLHQRNVHKYKELLADTHRKARESMGAEHRPLCILQLTYAGRYSKLYGPPQPIVAFNDPYLDVKAVVEAGQQTIITDAELKKLQDEYVVAALLAKEAGFDGVDIKTCHRYLSSELLAGHTREGHFGGSLENRTRFLLSTVDKVVAATKGELLIAVRLNAYDCHPYPYGWGVDKGNYLITDPSEPVWLVKELKRRGVSLVNISAGNPYYSPHIVRPYDAPLVGGSLPDEHPLEGVTRLFGLAEVLQSAVPEMNVVGAGYSWLRHYFANAAAANLNQGKAKLVGVGRLAFAYPNFAKDIMRNGALDPAKTCIACSMCSQIMRDGGTTGCVIRDKVVYGPIYKECRRGKTAAHL